MKLHIRETVIPYHQEELEAWKRGDKAAVLDGAIPPQAVINQPRYHFGEYYVLRHFKRAGWSGCCNYAIGTWEPDNPRYLEGRTILQTLFAAPRLAAFREQQRLTGSLTGRGEPDVFLYRAGGEALFLEVKKENDRIAPAQLACLAQIKAILQAEVGVVYLVPHGRAYTPKAYELDLESFVGRIAPCA